MFIIKRLNKMKTKKIKKFLTKIELIILYS